ncbi:MAG: DctP family TRAP transporter solute-binding subunit [Pseudomonadota bacterium]
MLRVFATAILLAAPIGAQAACEPGEVKATMSVVTALQGHPKGEAALALAERVNTQLNGRMCMEVFGRAELFDDDEALVALLDGRLQLAAPSLSKFEQYTKAFRLFDLPFLFDGPVEVMNFQNSPTGQQMLSVLDPSGLTAMGFWTNGMKQMSANRPLVMPGDAEGLTFRIQPSDVIEAQFDALGAETKRLAFSKVYEALVSGEVQGQENTWSNIYGNKFYQAQDGITATNHGYLGYLVVTSGAFLESLDPVLRDEFLLLFELTSHEYNGFAYETNEARALDVWRRTQKVVELSDDQVAAWREAFAPVYEIFGPEIGFDLIAEAQRFNASAPVEFGDAPPRGTAIVRRGPIVTRNETGGDGAQPATGRILQVSP